MALVQRMSGKHIHCSLLPYLPHVCEMALHMDSTHKPSPDTHAPDDSLLWLSVVIIACSGFIHTITNDAILYIYSYIDRSCLTHKINDIV